jgi:hypothetical protein
MLRGLRDIREDFRVSFWFIYFKKYGFQVGHMFFYQIFIFSHKNTYIG